MASNLSSYSDNFFLSGLMELREQVIYFFKILKVWGDLPFSEACYSYSYPFLHMVHPN